MASEVGTWRHSSRAQKEDSHRIGLPDGRSVTADYWYGDLACPLNGRPSAWAARTTVAPSRCSLLGACRILRVGGQGPRLQPDRSGGPYSAGVADCVCCRHGRQRLGSLRDPAVAQADGGRPAEQGCTTSRGGLPSGQGHQMPCGEPHGGPEPSPEQLVGERLCWDASPERLFGEGVGDADSCGDGDRTRTGSPRVRQPFGGEGAQGGATGPRRRADGVWAAPVRGAAKARARAGVRGSRRPTSSRCPSRWRSRLGSRVQRPTAASTQRRPPSWPEASPLASLWRSSTPRRRPRMYRTHRSIFCLRLVL